MNARSMQELGRQHLQDSMSMVLLTPKGLELLPSALCTMDQLLVRPPDQSIM
jgi:hypothetical protein